jgi:vacuolar-type H+-ATPase subunit H
MTDNQRNTRIREARHVASSLLDDLESSASSIDTVLMRSKRLARLMRDTDAQRWLDLETRGYPSGFSFSELGTCEKYAVSGGRLVEAESKYYTESLPALEANVQADEALLATVKPLSSASTKAKNFLEKSATEALIVTQIKLHEARKASFTNNRKIFASLKAAIHSYVSDVYLALELGNIAQDIFEEARNIVDIFVRSHCPKAAEKLIAINERMQEDSLESRTAALTSCRRLLITVADSVFPPRDDEWEDPSGKMRKVGAEQYKNRLLA